MHLQSYLTKMGCFSDAIVQQVVSNRQWPTRNRKYFAKLLANHLKNGDCWPTNLDSLIRFYDRSSATCKSIRELHAAAADYNPDTDLLGNQIVFAFKNGFSIVKLKPENLFYEKQHMSNCIENYVEYITVGGGQIYSLHDPQDRPHVHISFNGRSLAQIKGKGNQVPALQYGLLVNEWLYHIGVYCLDKKDYHSMIALHPDLYEPANEKTALFLASNTEDQFLLLALAKIRKARMQKALLENTNLPFGFLLDLILELRPGAIAYARRELPKRYSGNHLLVMLLWFRYFTWWIPRWPKRNDVKR